MRALWGHTAGMRSPESEVAAGPTRADDSVSGLATTRVPIVDPNETAGQIRTRIVGCSFDTLADIAVVSQGRLVGLIGIEVLLAAPQDAVAAH